MTTRTPRILLTVLVALALALGATPAVGGSLVDVDLALHPAGGAERALADLTGVTDRSTTVSAASLPEQATGIGPGSHLLVQVGGSTLGCTASYVWSGGGQLLLGAAGHCFLPDGATATHGPGADHDPAGTSTSVCVADCAFGGLTGFAISGTMVELGPLRYARQESPGGEQVGFDFGVVEIPAELHGLVRTTMPVFGGPAAPGTLSTGDQVCHYGNGVVVGEAFPTMGRTGLGILAEDDAWFVASAAAPGDSGSALQTCAPGAEGIEGIAAVGTLTHLTSLGVAGTTNAQSAAMAEDDAGLSLSLVLGDGTAADPGGAGGRSGGAGAGTGGPPEGRGGPPEGRGGSADAGGGSRR